MKKKHFTLGATLMAATLVLAGCGNGGASETSSEDYELANVEFPVQEDVTLHLMTNSSPLAPSDPNDKLIFQRLEEETGVHIEWNNIVDDYAEQRNLAIAAGDLPDGMFNSAASDQELLSWAEDGVIIPVNDLVDEYMPNLKAIYEEYPEYKALATAPDGNMYSFPWIEELGEGKESIHTVNGMAWINVEWLDNLGLEMPQTTDELMTVLEAFKNEDPNGNGEADEIPLSFIDSPGNEDFKILMAAFGGDGDNDNHLVVNNDQTLNFTADDEAYREGIEYFSELYQKGLIDREAFEHEWNAYVSKGNDHRYGVYFTWDKANITGFNDSYDVLPVLEGPNGDKKITRTNNYGFHRGRFVVTSANQNLELTAKWVDKMYEPLQSIQNNWGTYGDEEQQNIFELGTNENGDPMLQHKDLEGAAPGELRQRTEASGPLAVLDEYYGVYTTSPDDAQWRLDLMHEHYLDFIENDYNYPQVFMNNEDSARADQILADLNPYINQKRAEWIIGGITDEEWGTYLEELERLNLSELMEIYERNYEQYMSNTEE
ncbi:ABC transporter substrate-binding protein [Ruoffia tabacinasalis]|uniref:ABC transporter substrate-binding protein n=1 Tax=Ruoffia tabacinasalis TaxID=87458 RepID=UPI003CC81DDB